MLNVIIHTDIFFQIAGTKLFKVMKKIVLNQIKHINTFARLKRLGYFPQKASHAKIDSNMKMIVRVNAL